ncbi:MAG: L-threonylcarbamoyladenylate synthase [Gemmataceae bacterium]
MKTEIIAIDAQQPDETVITHAAEIVRRGGLVAFPTETVYGLGADALNVEAVTRLFAAKGRPAINPVIVHVASATAAQALVADWPATAARLANCFWPGPLTLVLPKRPEIPSAVSAGLPTVGLRVPAHPVALALIRAARLPIAAPSANRSTCLSPTQAGHVLRGLQGRIDLLLDAGPTAGGLESTVLDLTTVPPRLLRPGLVSPAALEEVIGPIERQPPKITSDQEALPAPGLMRRHYAPAAPLECVADASAEHVRGLLNQGRRVGWLTFAAPHASCPSNLQVIVMPASAPAYAAQLYAALHQLDAAGVERIVVDLPPEDDEWLAVHDRLSRAKARE